jgi:hypothetical protein
MRTQGAVSPKPFNRRSAALRAMGIQTTNFPDEMIAVNYQSEFNDQMAVLILRLRAAGATFHYNDQRYKVLPAFNIANTLQSIVVELHEAASALTASIRG